MSDVSITDLIAEARELTSNPLVETHGVRASWIRDVADALEAVTVPSSPRHFAPYGNTNATCEETVPRSVDWDTSSGEYADERFTVKRSLTTCPECMWRSGGVDSAVTAPSEDVVIRPTIGGNGRDGGLGENERERLAQRFHESYERLAPEFNYDTRVASSVPWEEVPEPNRSLMVAVAGEILSCFRLPVPVEPETPIPDEPWLDPKTGARFSKQNDLTIGYVYAPVEPEQVDEDTFSTGNHQRVGISGAFVCDTCINVLNINIRWDQAPCRKLPLECAFGGDER